MENTLENKSKFFAQYWGQEVHNYRLSKYTRKQDMEVSGSSMGYLLLKSLHDFTKEDAIEISKIENGFMVEDHERRGKVLIERIIIGYEFPSSFDNLQIITRVIDFLRSKGYAVPFMGLSVENIVEYGWIKIKQNG